MIEEIVSGVGTKYTARLDPWRHDHSRNTTAQRQNRKVVGNTWRLRWRNMVVKSSRLIVGNDQQRLIPSRPGHHGFHDLTYEYLAVSDVAWRLTTCTARRIVDKVRVDERDAGQ